MPPSAAIWDPEELLHIGSISPALTCVGQARQKNRRCRFPIAATDRQEASRLVLRISRMDTLAPAVDDALTQLARLLLCKANHRNEVEEIVAFWRDLILRRQIVAADSRRDTNRLGYVASDNVTR